MEVVGQCRLKKSSSSNNCRKRGKNIEADHNDNTDLEQQEGTQINKAIKLELQEKGKQ